MKKIIYSFILVSGLAFTAMSLQAQDPKSPAASDKKSTSTSCCSKGSSSSCCSKSGTATCSDKCSSSKAEKTKTEGANQKSKDQKSSK